MTDALTKEGPTEGQMDEPMEREKQGWKYKSKDGKTNARMKKNIVFAVLNSEP